MTRTQVYARNQSAAYTSREAEALALKKSAFLIDQALSNPNDATAFHAAWEITSSLWSILRTEMLREDCPLPAEVRANIISLSIFVDKQLVQAAHEQNPAPLKAVSPINKQLAAGLRGEVIENEEEVV